MNKDWKRLTSGGGGLSIKNVKRRIWHAMSDRVYRWRHPDTMIPPKSMDFVGGTGGVGFENVGKEFIRHFIELGQLQPHHRVLDVGCGIGRMAIPLTQYLSTAGEYHGFDIVDEGIQWCQNRITPRHPNFHFLHSDVYNKSYNSTGTIQSKDYKFAYADGSFDFVFLISVFTHMFTADMENYLNEIARVLKPGGRCLITFFLLNDESRTLMNAGKSTQNFVHALDGCFTINQKVPEYAIAFTEADINSLYAKKGLQIEQPIRYGSWCGRPTFLSYQDMVLARKT